MKANVQKMIERIEEVFGPDATMQLLMDSLNSCLRRTDIVLGIISNTDGLLADRIVAESNGV